MAMIVNFGGMMPEVFYRHLDELVYCEGGLRDEAVVVNGHFIMATIEPSSSKRRRRWRGLFAKL